MRHRTGSRPAASVALSLMVLGTGALAAVALSRRNRTRHFEEDAPKRALRDKPEGTNHLVGRTVTIARPRNEVYRRWRDIGRFPDFMENVVSVLPLDGSRSRWTVKGPGEAAVEFTSRIVEDQPDEAIEWQSEEDAAVANRGRVRFRDAPGGRGTVVDLEIDYDPPGGMVGALAAKMFQREPAIQARRDLKRFKQMMETGEVATSQMRRTPADGQG